jgi:signal transduction histidine kinase/ActR/RegA family two-component response regulator
MGDDELRMGRGVAIGGTIEDVASPSGSSDVELLTFASLAPASRLLVGIFVSFAVFNWIDFEPPVRGPMVLHDLVLVALYGVAAIGLSQGRVPARYASMLGALFGIGAASNILMALVLLRAPGYTTYLVVVVIAMGYLVLHRGWLVVGATAVFVGWLVCASRVCTPTELLHNGASMGVGVAVAGLLSTVRRRSEETAARQRRTLEAARDALQERTRQLDLALAEVEHQAREAEAASRAKSEFLANMSHEIRTPMTGILGTVELLLREDPTDDQREHLLRMETSGAHLLGLLTDVLDLSKIEAGHLKVESTPFLLHRTLQDAVLPFEATADAKGLKLLFTPDPALPRRVVGDPGCLRQIVTNLVSNAVKFTEWGFVEVRAGVRATDGFVVVEVEDTGRGVPKEAFDSLLDAFTQADTSVTREFGGTGLGLSISSRLAHAMGGSLEFESEIGDGSTFRVALPFDIDQSSGTWMAAPQAPTVAPPGQRVLVVDDQAVTRAVVLKQLQSAGIDASAVNDGLEALGALAPGHDYTAVLMDCHMPRMDGYEATRRIRADEAARGAPRVPIVALTANALQGEATRVAEAGMDGFIAKPARLSALLKTLTPLWEEQRKAPLG